MMIDYPFDFLSPNIFSVGSLTHLIFLLVVIFAGVFSAVMLFHWHRYALGNQILILATELVYLSVAAILLSVAFFSIY